MHVKPGQVELRQRSRAGRGPEPMKNDKKTCNFANFVHLINSSCPLLFPTDKPVHINGSSNSFLHHYCQKTASDTYNDRRDKLMPVMTSSVVLHTGSDQSCNDGPRIISKDGQTFGDKLLPP